jgi:quinol monooxygenase YgiN
VSIAEQALGTAGCLDFVITDLIDSGRVVIFERWESQAADETFAAATPATSKARQCSRRR